ncbi:MAG: acyl-CoA mutase large subunit family protein [bacterium]
MAIAKDPAEPPGLNAIAQAKTKWATEVTDSLSRVPERRVQFETLSGLPVERLYTPDDVAELDYLADLGFPGQYPYTRGPYPTMYRAQPWTMRQIAGYGTPADTNARLKYLIAQGQTGISVDFDMPTLMGYDSDDPRALGEVGREGVAVDTIDDLDEILEGIDIGSISVSMTINPTAWILFSMYLAIAERRDIAWEKLSGTVQADILKEYIAQKEWTYPIRAGIRIVRDLIIYSVSHLPHYNPINISGYHIREAGATAVQEAAFTLANGIAYVQELLRKGLKVDQFGPRLAFYFIAERDFFEELAKFRAARRVWAKIMKDRFGAQTPESMRLRFHCQTAGSSLTAKEPLNNIARTALQALAAILGGCQSLHTNGMDEALAIPSELAMQVALRTQQIILEETGAANTIDPLAGSYYVETLTSKIEEAVWGYLRRVDDLGGAVAATEKGSFQMEIAESAYRYQRQQERSELAVVGVNRYADPQASGKLPVPLHQVDPEAEARQKQRLARIKRERDGRQVERALEALADVARSDDNLISPTIEAVKAYATLGEIVNTLKAVFGTYVEQPVF